MNIKELKLLKDIVSKEVLTEQDVKCIRDIIDNLTPLINKLDVIEAETRNLSMQNLNLVEDIARLQEKKTKLEQECYILEQRQKDTMMHLRTRGERTMEKRTSDIDLREENKRTRTTNSSNNPLEQIADDKYVSTSSNSYLQDYIIIIKAMYELGMFTKYDPSIKSAEDLSKQKNATLAKIMEAFGKAVNIPDLGKSYNPLLQKAKNEKNEYDLTIFDSLKAIAEHRLNNHSLKFDK